MSLSLLLLVVGLGLSHADSRVLRPCFERYPNNRLVNLRPYHSEWRMKTEDSCLLFCAESASRCRSLVYDSVQHICHFFHDEGIDQAVSAVRMVYLRVIDRQCLDEKVDEALNGNLLAPAAPAKPERQNTESDKNDVNLANTFEFPTLRPVTDTDTDSVDFGASFEPEVEPLAIELTTPAEPQLQLQLEPQPEFQPEAEDESPTEPQAKADSGVIMKNVDNEDITPQIHKDYFKLRKEIKRMPARVADTTRINDVELDQQLSEVMQPSTFAGSFDDKNIEENVKSNGVYRDIRGPVEDRWQSSMEKMEKVKRTEKEKVWVESKEVSVNSKLKEKLDKLKRMSPEKYAMLMGEHRPQKEHEQEEQPIIEEEETMAAPETTTTTMPEDVEKDVKAFVQSRTMIQSGAKRIKFDENAPFSKKKSSTRRKPSSRRPKLKPVTFSTSYIEKAKSFVDSLKTADEENSLQTPDLDVFYNTECTADDVAVIVSFENSESAQEEVVDSSFAATKAECQRMCDEQNCRSFTYFDKHLQCMLNTRSDGVTLRTSSSGDFSASISTKFCYPKSLSMFSQCSNFVAFRDYNLQEEPREEFDGLPSGANAYQGMQLCVELCVLSNTFVCRSATFNPSTGSCRLLSEDSLSSPDRFKFDENQSMLYFENGCSDNDFAEAHGRSIEKVNKSPKTIKIKPILKKFYTKKA